MKHFMGKITLGILSLFLSAGFCQGQLSVTNNLQYWFEADSITGLNSGDPVALWDDSGSLDNDASQPIGANQPLWISNSINGKPVVRFDGVNDNLIAPSTFTSTGITAFVVGNYRSLAAENFFFHLRATNFNFHAFIRQKDFGGPNNKRWNAGFGGIQVGSSSQPDSAITNRFMVHSLFNGGGVVNYLTNNSVVVNFPGGVPPSIGGFTTLYTNFYLGSEALLGGYLNGDIAEALIYNGVLSAADRQSVVEYLYVKYSIPEPSTVMFVGAAAVLWVARRRRTA